MTRLLYAVGVLLCAAVISLFASLALVILGCEMNALICVVLSLFDIGFVLLGLIIYSLTRL